MSHFRTYLCGPKINIVLLIFVFISSDIWQIQRDLLISNELTKSIENMHNIRNRFQSTLLSVTFNDYVLQLYVLHTVHITDERKKMCSKRHVHKCYNILEMNALFTTVLSAVFVCECVCMQKGFVNRKRFKNCWFRYSENVSYR